MTDQGAGESVHGRFILGLIVVFYVALLKWTYIRVIVPVFGYSGLLYIRPHPAAEFLTWLLALAPVLWLPLHVDRPSRLPIWFQYLVVYIPSTMIPLYNASGGRRGPWSIVMAILAALILVQAISSLPRLALPIVKVGRSTFLWTLLGLGAVLLVPILRTFGLSFKLPSLAEVYGVRAEFRDTLAAAGPIVAYAVAWFGRVVAPLLIVGGLINRRWWAVGMGFAGEALIFSISGSKSVALSGFFLVGLWTIYRRGGRWMGVLIAGALTGVVALSILMDAAISQVTLESLFIRRAIITPGLLTGYFYDFFSVHPQLHLSGSIFHWFATNPYDTSPPFLIGAWYLGDITQSANVNMWGDAYSNFGNAGILAFAVVLGAVLWLFDSVARGRDRATACLMLGVPSLMLTNSGLPTVLLTHGFALTLGLVALLPVEANVEVPA